MEERSILVTVEAVGPLEWKHTTRIEFANKHRMDPRHLEPVWFAQVVDEEGRRYHVTPGMCFRNGTSMCEAMVGKKGRLGLYGWSPVSFNCPVLFGREAT